jgi:hypothetical protein
MKVIIVHGSNDSEEEAKSEKLGPENLRQWKPWLKKELESRKIEVSNELYPEDWNPNYGEWKKVFEKNKIDENSILIGHSAGTSFLVRWLGESKKKIKKLILVAPWKFSENKLRESFYDFSINPLIKKQIKEIIYFTSNDEHFLGKKSLKAFHEILGGEILELKNHGHFTRRKEFPELLQEILE